MQKLLHVVLICLGAGGCTIAGAQSRPTAEKRAEISVFFTRARMGTPYTVGSQPGYVAGADYTWLLDGRPYGVSFETRGSYTPVGPVSGAQNVSAGVRVDRTYSYRLRPYVDFLVGGGQVNFAAYPDSHDRAFTYTYGGGVDFAVVGPWGVKVDAQGSRWDLAPTNIPHPFTFGVGVTYRIPERDRLAR